MDIVKFITVVLAIIGFLSLCFALVVWYEGARQNRIDAESRLGKMERDIECLKGDVNFNDNFCVNNIRALRERVANLEKNSNTTNKE